MNDNQEFIQTQKCTNCKVERTFDQFVGKLDQPVKRCLKCREKDAKQKQRPDVMEKRRKRQNEKQYYKKHREHKREENEEEYLKHNNETAKKWRTNNKEHLAEWQTNNFRARLYAIKQQAQQKEIEWKDELTDEICYQMMTSNCYYCNLISDATLGGIDRMNNQGCYETSNIVPCCKKCNFMKGSLDTNTFIKRCQHISNHFGNGGNYYSDIWCDSQSVSYKRYANRASNKQLEFTLTKEQFNTISDRHCYYCNKENNNTHRNGVDRQNNAIGYIPDNCVSCCSECNSMKGQLDIHNFIEQCTRVSNHSLLTNIFVENMPICNKRICKRQKQEIEKVPIRIVNQQPKKEQIVRPHVETYIPKQRNYSKGTNMPSDCPIKPEDLPKYCRYCPVEAKRSEGFIYERKQKDKPRISFTFRDKNKTIEEKFQQLLDLIKEKGLDEQA